MRYVFTVRASGVVGCVSIICVLIAMRRAACSVGAHTSAWRDAERADGRDVESGAVWRIFDYGAYRK